MTRLAPELQRKDGQYNKYILSAHPNIIYANGYGEEPKIGDIIIPGRIFKTPLYSWSDPAHYELSQVSQEQIGLHSAQHADYTQKVCLFRLASFPTQK